MLKSYLLILCLCVNICFTDSDIFELARMGDLKGVKERIEAEEDLKTVDF